MKRLFVSLCTVASVAAELPAQKKMSWTWPTTTHRAVGCYRSSVPVGWAPDTLTLIRYRTLDLGWHRRDSYQTSWDNLNLSANRAPPIWNAIGPDSVRIELDPTPYLWNAPVHPVMRLAVTDSGLVGVVRGERGGSASQESTGGRGELGKVVTAELPIIFHRVPCPLR